MKAKDLRLAELVDFSEGRLSLHERRLVLHDLHAFAQFRKDLVDHVGLERARRILTRFGYFWGQADAAAMKRVFEWDSPEEWVRAGSRLQTLQGVVKAVVKKLVLDLGSGRFEMDVSWQDSSEAEEHVIAVGQSPQPACWILVGYASGYASFCMNRDVYFIERNCVAKGDRVCGAMGKDRESWGAEITPHLTYFQAEDIHGIILDLTRRLKDQTRELAKQRQRLKLLEGNVSGRFTEVHSASFRRVVELASRVAPYDSAVLITGESGTGKEVLAKYIHENSRRRAGPFVTVNCSALPETLLESELFGHKAGSFTGAVKDRVGLFEEAQKGTVFLDEIGDITLAMQMKLLRVLQEKEILRVGESRPRKVDVRILAATNRNLTEAIRDGAFRDDLYYRLRVIEIEVPPLRERREDILHLARLFVARFAKSLGIPALRLDSTCIDYLQEYQWPGNVRELENAIERAAVLSKDGLILPEHLPSSMVHPALGQSTLASPLSRKLADVESDHILTVMRLVGDNKTRAARALGISPATLWRKLKQLHGPGSPAPA